MVLKTLRLSCAVLLKDEEGDSPKKLIDELPASLEELELVEDICPEEARWMFAGVLETKRERLPSFAYVAFAGAIPFDEGTVGAYERVGLTMDWRIQSDGDPRERRFYKTGRMWLGDVRCMRVERG